MPDNAVGGPTGATSASETQARREFLKKLTIAGATVPAVALLLSGKGSPAQAQTPQGSYGGGTSCGTSCGCGSS